MTRPDPPLPEGPLGKAFIESLMKEFAEKRGMTLEEYLLDADQNIAIEENYLDKPPQRRYAADPEDVDLDALDEQMRQDYRDYRDNKRWLDED